MSNKAKKKPKKLYLNSRPEITSDFINRKKELVYKDYESLFEVYSRETQIVYNFRGWAITILTIYFTFLFTVQPSDFVVVYVPGLCTVLIFYFLEASERGVMRNLLGELRLLERIFMIQNNQEFADAITNYEFRDLKDEKKTFLYNVPNFLKSLFDIKVAAWNVFLLLIYFIITFYFKTTFLNKKHPNTATPQIKTDSLKKTRSPSSKVGI